MSPRTAAASIAALRMEKLHKSARNSRANHFVLRCPAPGARSFAPHGAVWFYPGAKVFASPRRLLLAWRRPSSNLSRGRTRFSFRLRNYGETKDRDQEYKGCHADHDLLHACCPATNTKSLPRIRRVCGVSHCLSSIHQQLHGLHTELRPMCN